MYTKTKTTSCALFIVSSTWICQRRTETRIYCMFAYSFTFWWKKFKLNRSILSKLSEFVYFHYNKWITKKEIGGRVNLGGEWGSSIWLEIFDDGKIYHISNKKCQQAYPNANSWITQNQKHYGPRNNTHDERSNGLCRINGHTCMWMGNRERESIFAACRSEPIRIH